MDRYFCVECSTCGVVYGLFDEFQEATRHAATSGHDAEATEKTSRPNPLFHPSRHGDAGPLRAPLATCGSCGAEQEINSREELVAFSDAHEESCDPDVAIQFGGTLDELPD